MGYATIQKRYHHHHDSNRLPSLPHPPLQELAQICTALLHPNPARKACRPPGRRRQGASSKHHPAPKPRRRGEQADPLLEVFSAFESATGTLRIAEHRMERFGRILAVIRRLQTRFLEAREEAPSDVETNLIERWTTELRSVVNANNVHLGGLTKFLKSIAQRFRNLQDSPLRDRVLEEIQRSTKSSSPIMEEAEVIPCPAGMRCRTTSCA